MGAYASRSGALQSRRNADPDASSKLTDTAAANLFRAVTRVTRPEFVPELQLRVADELMPTWEATEKSAGHAVAPPFWAFLWPGSQALARLILDQPALVKDKRVFDFGSGCGLAAIAAAKVGATHVIACDVDTLAAHAQQANAELNGVTIESRTRNLIGRPLPDIDVVLAGDVCYEKSPAEELLVWLRKLAGTGILVLLADPGRSYAPSSGVDVVETYDVPTTRELESGDRMKTTVWRLAKHESDRVAWGTSTSQRR